MAGADMSAGPARASLQVRREPFEFGLLPLSSLYHKFVDGVPAFLKLRSRLQQQAGGSSSRVDAAAIAECLSISQTHAHLLLDTLACVLPEDGPEADALASATVGEVDTVGADVDVLVLFLFVQLYRRLPFRPHRDPASVADVWPQPSPFDSLAASPSSPLQNNKAGIRPKSSWGGAEEEHHQLQFIQKHLPGMLEALGMDSEEEKVISPSQFDKLGLLLRSTDLSAAPLCHSTPFFANSDPAMPAAPVPITRVLQFLKESVHTASHREETASANAPQGGDVGMPDAPSSPSSSSGSSAFSNGGPWPRDWQPQGVTCVDGVTKMSVLKGDSNIEKGVIRVSHCHDAVVYVLAPLRYASIFGCTDCIVVLGATGKAVKVEHCERVQLLAPCARIRINNCRECVFYLGTNQNPLILGDNHKIQVAPFNTFYPRLDAHLSEVGVDPTVNMWNVPITLGKTDPHDPNLPMAGAADAELETAALLPPERFVPFVVPFRTASTPSSPTEQQQQSTRANPFVLPKAYLQALQQKTKTVETLRQTLKTAVLEENKKKELTNVIQAHFKEWLLASGNIRQVYDLARLDRDP